MYSLPRDQAKLGYPIDFEAIVTYCDAGWGMLFVQDKGGNTYIDISANRVQYPLGSRVRVTAVTTINQWATVIDKPRIQVMSAGPEVTPLAKSIAELETGANDSQFVVVEGVLHPCTEQGPRACYRLVQGNRDILLLPRLLRSTQTDRLVGATVRARGVAAARVDEHDMRIGVRMFLDSLKQIEVDVPPLDEKSPTVPVQSLHPQDAELTQIRQVHLRGRVSWVSEGAFTLQDPTGTILVNTTAPAAVHLGDPVDVIGFPAIGRFGMELRDASARLTTDQLVPMKLNTVNSTVDEILKASLNGKRVRLRARLASLEVGSAQTTFHLTDKGQPFTALLLQAANMSKLAPFPQGATLDLVGVEVLQSRGKNAPPTVVLLIDSADDILLRPSENWLTGRRALAALGCMALCFLIPFIWVKQLQRTVRRQLAINREQLEKELRLATKYQRLFERNLAAVYTLRSDGSIPECNGAFLKLLGLHDREQLQGRSYWEFEIESDHLEDLKSDRLHDVLSNCKATLRRDDGNVVHVLKNISPVETPEGMVYEITAIDVSQMYHHQVELEVSRDTAVMNSLIDPLTALPNRRMLVESLPRILDRAMQREELTALLFIDLDSFKNVNDTLGHAAGDELLIHIANKMRSLMRRDDLLVRLGGDEFMAILSDLGGREGAERVAEEMLRSIDRPVTILGHTVQVGASIGIGICPDDATDAETLIARADLAMYAAKRQGKNRRVFYSETLMGAEVSS